ncbi:MAG: DNA topoisomerase I, partial [Wolbachia pipientis]|nr:DNA topoisomerase I [Wolbachia pipientis]
SLPKIIGKHPNTEKKVKIGLGRFGYYIFYDDKYFPLKKSSKEALKIQLNEAIQIIANNSQKWQKSLGLNKNGKEVFILSGKYGFYIKIGRTKVALSKNIDIESINLKKALDLIKNKK